MPSLSPKLEWSLANPKWAAALNPILALPVLGGNQLDDIIITVGVPKVINHLLGRMPQGWILVDNVQNANIWRTAQTTTTITLSASATTTISMWVF